MVLNMYNETYPTLTLMGSPGCGKGTQSKFMEERLGFQHISTGDLCRTAIERHETEALEFQTLMAEGKLVPDDFILKLLNKKMDSIRQQENQPYGLILDGYPRNTEQAKHFKQVVNENQLRFLGMIYIYVPDDIVFERMMARKDSNGKQRSDDQAQTIRERIRIFHEKTLPLVDFYRNEYEAVQIDGLGTPEEVFERIVPVVHEWQIPCAPQMQSPAV